MINVCQHQWIVDDSHTKKSEQYKLPIIPAYFNIVQYMFSWESYRFHSPTSLKKILKKICHQVNHPSICTPVVHLHQSTWYSQRELSVNPENSGFLALELLNKSRKGWAKVQKALCIFVFASKIQGIESVFMLFSIDLRVFPRVVKVAFNLLSRTPRLSSLFLKKETVLSIEQWSNTNLHSHLFV